MAPVGKPSEPEPAFDAPLVTFHLTLSPAATTNLSVKGSVTGTKKVPTSAGGRLKVVWTQITEVGRETIV
jgi:hypothetical protein